MDEKQKISYAVEQILSDYKAIYDFMMVYLENRQSYHIMAGIIPYLSLIVYEGYDFLNKNNQLNGVSININHLREIRKWRAKGIKLYENFSEKAYLSIEKFIAQEQNKFGINQNNFCIKFINFHPIGNYHLYAKKIFNTSIGTYNDQIPSIISDLVTTLSSFITNILCVKNIELVQIEQKQIFFDIQNVDLDITDTSQIIKIKNNPVLVTAFLDVLCFINYYLQIFSKINSNFYFDLKFKYTVFYYAVISLKHIFDFCSNKNLLHYKQVYKQITECHKTFLDGELRNNCCHYGYLGLYKIAPIDETFKRVFKMRNINEISNFLFVKLEELAEILDGFLFYP